MQKKKIVTLLAASAIIMNCNGITANAQTVKNTQDYNLSVLGVNVNENVTLNSGKQVRAVMSSGELVIEEKDSADADQWTFVDNIGNAVLKEIAENSTGGYIVTYLKDNFKYTRVYDENSSKVEDEKMVGVVVLNYYDEELTLDLIVDEKNYETTIVTPNGNEVIKNFIPTLAENLGNVNISMIGKGKDDSTSVIVVTENKRVIQSFDAAAILGSKYSEVKAVGGIEVDEEKFILSGYAVKADDPGKRDGFVIQFDGEGNKDKNAPIKILPASADNKYNASINIVIRFESGNLLLMGDNIGSLYINALDYNDPRIVKESLKLAGGKTYQVVESQAATYSTNKTYTVKCIDGDFEYDIETYVNVKDIKLVPGNDNQVLVAVQNENDTTEIGIIDTKAAVKLDEYGDAVGMVTNGIVIKNTDGPILNIDLNNIKVNENGQVIVNQNGEADSQGVTLDGIKPGNPVEVTPNPPADGGETEAPEEGGEANPDQPSDGDDTETPEEPGTDGDTETKPEVPGEPSSPEEPDEPMIPDTPVIPEEPGDEVVTPDGGDKEETPKPPVKDEEVEMPVTPIKPINNVQAVNIDNGEKVTFDVAKPKNIKIISSKLTNKEIQYIVVNGVKITKPSMARAGVLDTIVDYNDEYYTVTDGGIVLFSKLFDTLKLNSNGRYDIGVAFTDGEKIENLTTISIVDTSNNNNTDNTVKPSTDSNSGSTVTKPSVNNSTGNAAVTNKDNNVNNSNSSSAFTYGKPLETTEETGSTDTTDIAEELIADSSTSESVDNDNKTTDKDDNNESTNDNKVTEAASEKTSKTGIVVAVIAIIGAISAAVGTSLFKKKK